MNKFRMLWLSIGLSLFCLLVTACSSSSNKYEVFDSDRIYVLSMNRMIHDCVQQIVGKEITPIVLIDGSIDPHSYEMVKGDEDKIAASRLIFCNGLGLEHTACLRKHLENHPKVVFIGDALVAKGFNPLQEDGFFDPHIWTVMHIWREGVEEIIATLIQEFPQWEATFKERGACLLQKMDSLDSWAKKSLNTIPLNQRYLVSGHNAFGYFTKYYLATEEERENDSWSQRCIAPEGVSPEAQVSIRDIMRVVDYIYEHDVQVIFPEDTLNQDALHKILTGLNKKHDIRFAKGFLYSDNVFSDYFETFTHNVKLITEELGGTIIE